MLKFSFIMRHDKTLLLVWSLALLVRAQDLSPTSSTLQPTCEPILSYMKNEFNCSGIIVSTSDEQRVASFNCHNALLDCNKLPHLSYAEGNILRRMTVSHCAVEELSCALTAVNASGVSALTYSGVSTRLTAEAVNGLEMLTTLMIYGTSNDQAEIPVEALQMLPQLEYFRFVESGLTTIPPYVFNTSGVTKLKFLEISVNNVKVLSTDSFNGLKDLETLSLFKNKIEEIDENALRGLDSLQTLYLDENNLSVLPSRLFVSTPRLRVLTLPRNQRALRVLSDALTGLSLLEEITIQSYGVLTLEPASLSHLPALTSVSIKDSGVTTLTDDLFVNSTAIVNLTLSGNDLSSLPITIFAGLSKLLKLDLSRNKLEKLDKALFRPLEQIRELYLDRNLIQVLDEKLFTFPHLTKLGLSYNRISNVHNEAFRTSALSHLDLSNNRLAWRCRREDDFIVTGTYVDLEFYSPLQALVGLETLNLSHNNISNVCGDWLNVMVQLREFDLSSNNITELTAADIYFLSNPITVDLQYNQISSIEPPVFMNKIPTLKLDQNPFNCDCNLYDFLHSLKNLPFDIDQAICQSPSTLKGCSLNSLSNSGRFGSKNVSVNDLICPVRAPFGCDCLVRPGLYRTECDCDKLVDLPNPTLNGLNIDKMKLKLHSLDNTSLPNFVTMLELSGLGLEILPDLPEHLTFVDLTDNKLERVPLEFLQRNLSMKLEKNPLVCDCSSADDVANIKTYYAKIEDYKSLFCKDGVNIQEVGITRLCSVKKAVTYGTTLAVFGLLLAVAFSLAYKYSLEIRIWLFSKGITFCSSIADIEDREKPFDIFLSFVHQDEKFVNETLLPKLEERYKVCVHTRDWIVGESIVNQIYRSVAESRRTLIVLSNDYMQSESWAQEEFRAAYLQTAKDGRPRCVVILYDGVKLDNAPEQIKAHVKLNTYIEWNDKLFWERLYYAIPNKLKAKDVRRREVTKKAVKALNGGLNVVVNDEGKLVNVPIGKNIIV